MALIIKSPEKFNKKEIECLLTKLKFSQENQSIFLQYLNNNRAISDLKLKKETINILAEILLII